MDPIANEVGKMYRGFVGMFQPVLKDSKFLEKGYLTPEEFVQAGDNLIQKCPTWEWATGPQKAKCLPEDKQVLITRNVPCRMRVNGLEAQNETKEVEVDDEWISTDSEHKKTQEKAEDIADLDEEEAKNEAKTKQQNAATNEGVDDDDVLDLDDMAGEVDNEEETKDNNVLQSGNYFVKEEDDDNIVRTRSYDLSITYDTYYKTPRLWLFGYNEYGQPLSGTEIFEDVMADYAKKTVTIENHPVFEHSCASIHPCNHANVMKNIIDTLQENGVEAQVHQALFVFLKFISSVVPTIEYDFTMDFSLQ